MSTATDLEKKIIKQMEYYFSDINLAKDKFMRDELKKEDGWVKLETFLTFNRVKSLTEDANVIKTALEKSENKILEFNESSARRITPFDLDNENILDQFADETLYVKGFSSDANLDDIMSWFSDCASTIPTSITMRRFKNSTFKGSVFATFASKEDAEAFLKCEAGAKFKNILTERKWQADFKVEKENEWKDRAFEKQKRQELQAKAKKQEAKDQMIKGCLLELSNLPPKEAKPDGDEPRGQNPIIEFKKWLSDLAGEELGARMWLDVDSDSNKAIANFKIEDAASKVADKLKESGSKYKDHELAARVVDGDEEIEFWEKHLSKKFSKAQKRPQGRYGRGGGGGNYGKRRRA